MVCTLRAGSPSFSSSLERVMRVGKDHWSKVACREGMGNHPGRALFLSKVRVFAGPAYYSGRILDRIVPLGPLALNSIMPGVWEHYDKVQSRVHYLILQYVACACDPKLEEGSA